MAHTPGPWEARPHDGQIVLNGSNCYDIREIYNDHGGFNPDDIRLMAAAPDMLDVLRKIVHKTYTGCGDFRVIDLCEDAITKAEGRE
jgi:hypothetical protein